MSLRDSNSRQFGVVFFDEEADPTAGWAAVAGGQAYRISGVNELSTDVIWWTNISFENFFKSTEAWRSPWLRHDKYLVVSPKDVLQEWGVDPKTIGGDYSATLVSGLFNRVMVLAFRLIRDVEPRARMEEVFIGRFLREDLRRLLPEAEYPKGEAASIVKSGHAWQEFTRTTVRGIKGARWIMLRKPRLAYAHEMLQTPIPKGPFEFYGRSDLRKHAKDKLNWVLHNDNPCLAEVAINRLDADVAPIYGFGNATDQDKRIQRSWVAHPELIVMSKFAEIDVKSVYMGHEYDLIGPRLPEAVKDFLSDKYTELSWSGGVIAETLWRAAALGEEKASNKSSNEDDRASSSWQGVWIKGADKANMFLTAMQMTEIGYSVVSYGLGWVRVMALEEDIPDLIRDALSYGLVPNLLDVPEGMYNMNSSIPWGGDKFSLYPAKLVVSANRNMLWNLDKLPLLDRKQRKLALEEIIKANEKKKL